MSDARLEELLQKGYFASADVFEVCKELQSYRAVMPKVREALNRISREYWNDEAREALALLEQIERGDG